MLTMRSQFESEINFDIFFKIFIFYMKRVQTLRMFHWGRVQTRSLLAFHTQIKRVSRKKIFTWEGELNEFPSHSNPEQSCSFLKFCELN